MYKRQAPLPVDPDGKRKMGTRKLRWRDGVQQDAERAGIGRWLHWTETVGEISFSRPEPAKGYRDPDDDVLNAYALMCSIIVKMVVNTVETV